METYFLTPLTFWVTGYSYENDIHGGYLSKYSDSLIAFPQNDLVGIPQLCIALPLHTLKKFLLSVTTLGKWFKCNYSNKGEGH